MKETIIEVQNLTKVYGKGEVAYKALRGVDFTAQRGDFLMLSGPSGSGKTTLLSILGCVLRPTSGTYRLFGNDLSNAKENALTQLRIQQIGFIFQGHNLIASLSALENVALMLTLRGAKRSEAKTEARKLLARVGLDGKYDNKPRDLSGGQRQRVAIARALAGNPPLVLADEPTAALDAENGLLVTHLLKDLCRERGDTAVVVTHDSRIFNLADRMVRIEDGLIKEELK